MKLIVALVALLMVAPQPALASEPSATVGQVRELTPMAVWPEGVPSMKGWPGLAEVPVQEELRENGEQVWNVTEPTIQAFLPDPDKANGMAVVIAPGGGFRLLAIHHEGTRVARWLADRGVAAFVLKYRLIQTPPGETNEQMRQRVQATLAPGVGGIPGVEDARQALRLVRVNAARWHIDPTKIGVAGFSAGGHVAAMTMFGPKAERPAFAGLIYGMPFGESGPEIPLANLPYPEGTPSEPWLQPPATPAPDRLPPMFLAMAQDDLAVGVGFRAFYDRLFAAGYRPETHLYSRGAHAFGMVRHNITADLWTEQFLAWAEMVTVEEQ
ncbi:alpha/beta hydrolase [uncultured Parasphingorhabdus sp.]|uniref:alpha/beta hydrolase n=1 Tax=uncultured Parasphingorhabdus sp. TaxID=2709694 RepID=UPI0030DD7586|tara:strand:+ start:63596 stop:64573 length:978 start_codon:yes stop_codon:yes gene_type:complete